LRKGETSHRKDGPCPNPGWKEKKEESSRGGERPDRGGQALPWPLKKEDGNDKVFGENKGQKRWSKELCGERARLRLDRMYGKKPTVHEKEKRGGGNYLKKKRVRHLKKKDLGGYHSTKDPIASGGLETIHRG